MIVVNKQCRGSFFSVCLLCDRLFTFLKHNFCRLPVCFPVRLPMDFPYSFACSTFGTGFSLSLPFCLVLYVSVCGFLYKCQIQYFWMLFILCLVLTVSLLCFFHVIHIFLQPQNLMFYFRFLEHRKVLRVYNLPSSLIYSFLNEK
jgi:hypothetical protein